MGGERSDPIVNRPPFLHGAFDGIVGKVFINSPFCKIQEFLSARIARSCALSANDRLKKKSISTQLLKTVIKEAL